MTDSKIVRTPTKATGGVTPDELEKMKAMSALWIGKAFSTERRDEEEGAEAVRAMYRAADLEEPKVISMVPNPFAMAVAGSVAVFCSDLLKKGTDKDVIEQVRKGALLLALSGNAGGSAKDSAVQKMIAECVQSIANWRRFTIFGYIPSACYHSAAKHILGLDLPQADTYARFCDLASPCFMTPDFAIFSDRPTEIHHVDGVPHNENGPQTRYTDGWQFFYIDGVAVSEKTVMNPSELTVEEISEESNTDARQIMIQRKGPDKYAEEAGAQCLDIDERTSIGGGSRALMQMNDGSKWLVAKDGSTDRVYWMPVEEDASTCREAHEGIAGTSEDLFVLEG